MLLYDFILYDSVIELKKVIIYNFGFYNVCRSKFDEFVDNKIYGSQFIKYKKRFMDIENEILSS